MSSVFFSVFELFLFELNDRCILSACNANLFVLDNFFSLSSLLFLKKAIFQTAFSFGVQLLAANLVYRVLHLLTFFLNSLPKIIFWTSANVCRHFGLLSSYGELRNYLNGDSEILVNFKDCDAVTFSSHQRIRHGVP